MDGNGANGRFPTVLTYGCNDWYAENYNPDVDVNDGSCFGYPDNGEHSLSFDGTDDYVDIIGIPYTDLLGANEIEINAKFRWAGEDLDGGPIENGILTNTSSGNSQIELSIGYDDNEIRNVLWLAWSEVNQPGMQVSFLDALEPIEFGIWYDIKVILQMIIKVFGILQIVKISYELIETDNVLFNQLGSESDNVMDLKIGWGNSVYDTHFFNEISSLELKVNDDDLVYWPIIAGSDYNLFMIIQAMGTME